MEIKETGNIHFGKAIENYWKGFVSFSGNTTRASFWYTVLFNFLVYAALAFLGMCALFLNLKNVAIFILFVGILFYVATFIPNLSRQARRLNDLGFSMQASIIILIVYKLAAFASPIVGIAIFILDLLPAKQFSK